MISTQTLVDPDELLITPELERRPARPASPETELNAYRELSVLMTEDAQRAVDRFLDLALELCPAAGSSGLSEIARNAAGEEIFLWTALAGAYARFVGGSTPRNFSPCWLCLERKRTVLVDRPARVFDYLADADPPIVEGLIVPLYDGGGEALGTLWVASHDPARRFDATDARVMEQLAVQLVLALKLRRKGRIMHQLETVARDREMLIREVHHRVKNTIQMTSSLLHLQQSAASGDARAVLGEARTRLGVLAKVHEALLQPQTDGVSGRIDMAALVHTLAGALAAGAPSGRGIRVLAECDPLLLDPDAAIPLGLIINEAVTNAFKHAFPGERSGQVRISLRDGDGLVLTVEDDGNGFDGEGRYGSLGMRLMRRLARQLGGKLSVSAKNGTCVRLEFARPADRAASEPKADALPEPA